MSATARMRPAAARKRVGPRSALERLLWRKAGQEWMADTALGPHDAFGVYGGFAQQTNILLRRMLRADAGVRSS
jgi:hypothetical protein